MRTLFASAITALAMSTLLLISTGTGPAMAADGKAVIEKRIAFMRADILKPFLVIKSFVKDGKGTAADVAKAATALSAAAHGIPPLFPKGTSRGDFDAKVTRSLPKIWEDWKGFEDAAGVLAAEAVILANVAAGGDAAAIGTQFGAMGKHGCGGCHTPFQGDKVK
jgi:cytochrome c556